MNKLKNSCKGFTLLELLVVILIIGILAGIALPQYKKSIKKAHLSTWLSYVNTYMKGIDLYLLQNGMPMTKIVEFSGTAALSGREFYNLDFDLPCTSISNQPSSCGTSAGHFHVGCSDHCWINMGGRYMKSPILKKGESLQLAKNYPDLDNDSWVLYAVSTINTDTRKLVCELWKNHFGIDRMSEDAAASCAEVGIN